MSIATKKFSNFFYFSNSITSDMNLSLSPMCLFLTHAVCCEVFKYGRTFFSFSEKSFDIISRSTCNKEISLHFCMNLLSLSFLY